ncbi:unnamed protein product [Darwinula stevensoni]|uniref:Uncharacterized protein n=1 Tax=Darwinula stevensoni TaxID=69355 RepID=A0A7R9ADH6_9CRUS|nr:unnamed protein product [Darwinula stevensoni]CAG0900994.1 unnamed protein product [Darwinula stevensoni]
MEETLRSRARIGTHDGTVSCGAALACFMLKQLPQYRDAEIVRSRDETVLSTCDVLVDVGGTYDHATRRYDHHQEFLTARLSTPRSGKKWKTHLSSAGLLFKHYGEEIISCVLNCPVEDPKVEAVFDKVYENFVEEIDAFDNGIEVCHQRHLKYRIRTSLPFRVRGLNPVWNDKSKNSDEIFSEAMQMTGREFLDRIRFYGEVWWPALELLINAVGERFQVDESGMILELPDGGFPWKKHLFHLEDEGAIPKYQVFFVIYKRSRPELDCQETPSEEETFETWMVQGVPFASDPSISRQAGPVIFPEEWRGLKGQELEEKSGLSGVKSVRRNGYIGEHETREGAISMAKRALKESESKVQFLQALGTRFSVDESGHILFLSSGWSKWIIHLFHYEAQGIIPKNEILFVIFKDNRIHYSWKVQTVPISSDLPTSRQVQVPLLQKQEFEEKTDLRGIKFVHMSGHLGDHETRDGAISMAKTSLAAFQPRLLLLKALDARFKVDESGNILVLSAGCSGWEKHLFHLEAQGIIPKNEVFLVIFKEEDDSAVWKVQAVRLSSDSVILRQARFKCLSRSKPKESELSTTSLAFRVPLLHESEQVENPEGPTGTIFVHEHETREGAINTAKKSLAAFLPRLQLLKALDARFLVSSSPPFCERTCRSSPSISQMDESGRILTLPAGKFEVKEYFPFKDSFYELERQGIMPENMSFLIFPDSTGMWKVRALPIGPRNSTPRQALFIASRRTI